MDSEATELEGMSAASEFRPFLLALSYFVIHQNRLSETGFTALSVLFKYMLVSLRYPFPTLYTPDSFSVQRYGDRHLRVSRTFTGEVSPKLLPKWNLWGPVIKISFLAEPSRDKKVRCSRYTTLQKVMAPNFRKVETLLVSRHQVEEHVWLGWVVCMLNMDEAENFETKVLRSSSRSDIVRKEAAISGCAWIKYGFLGFEPCIRLNLKALRFSRAFGRIQVPPFFYGRQWCEDAAALFPKVGT